jgi:Protein of unknown function (DUF2726)
MMERTRRSRYRPKVRTSTALPYVSRGQLLSRGEMAFFRALRSAIGREYLITFKVRAADLLSCSEESWDAGFGYMVARHHLDFVVCDYRSTEILAAIELDDRSHELDQRKRRDDFLNDAFAAARIPLIRFRAASKYAPRTIAEEIDRHLVCR